LNHHTDNVGKRAMSIMRPNKYGNRFVIGRDGGRAAAVAKHRADFKFKCEDPAFLAQVISDLRGRDLVCCCAPAACHGDVILEVANAAN
jgi:hypothetical protein